MNGTELLKLAIGLICMIGVLALFSAGVLNVTGMLDEANGCDDDNDDDNDFPLGIGGAA